MILQGEKTHTHTLFKHWGKQNTCTYCRNWGNNRITWSCDVLSDWHDPFYEYTWKCTIQT